MYGSIGGPYPESSTARQEAAAQLPKITWDEPHQDPNKNQFINSKCSNDLTATAQQQIMKCSQGLTFEPGHHRGRYNYSDILNSRDFEIYYSWYYYFYINYTTVIARYIYREANSVIDWIVFEVTNHLDGRLGSFPLFFFWEVILSFYLFNDQPFW